MHGANRTGRPFTGDYAGILLYATLAKFGFSNSPVGEGGGRWFGVARRPHHERREVPAAGQ
jgi:hypothetical protein